MVNSYSTDVCQNSLLRAQAASFRIEVLFSSVSRSLLSGSGLTLKPDRCGMLVSDGFMTRVLDHLRGPFRWWSCVPETAPALSSVIQHARIDVALTDKVE